MLNPIFDQIVEIMKRYINIYIKKWERYSVSCVLISLPFTNCVTYFRFNTKLNLE